MNVVYNVLTDSGEGSAHQLLWVPLLIAFAILYFLLPMFYVDSLLKKEHARPKLSRWRYAGIAAVIAMFVLPRIAAVVSFTVDRNALVHHHFSTATGQVTLEGQAQSAGRNSHLIQTVFFDSDKNEGSLSFSIACPWGRAATTGHPFPACPHISDGDRIAVDYRRLSSTGQIIPLRVWHAPERPSTSAIHDGASH